MPRTKKMEEDIEADFIETDEPSFSGTALTPAIGLLEDDFHREDLNRMRDKLNEVIKSL